MDFVATIRCVCQEGSSYRAEGSAFWEEMYSDSWKTRLPIFLVNQNGKTLEEVWNLDGVVKVDLWGWQNINQKVCNVSGQIIGFFEDLKKYHLL